MLNKDIVYFLLCQNCILLFKESIKFFRKQFYAVGCTFSFHDAVFFKKTHPRMRDAS